MAQVGKTTHAQLTAASTATTPANIGNIQPASAEFLVTVASINTNVVVVPEYSNDGFSTVAAKGAPVTITANGVYTIPASVNYKDRRLYFLSESGGTAATIDVQMVTFY